MTSMNGVTVQSQQPLSFIPKADAVLFGSGRQTRMHIENEGLLKQLAVDASRQLVGAQCSGVLFLQRLGLLHAMPASTDSITRPLLEALGVTALRKHFYAQGDIATTGGCMASACLAAWVICKLGNREQAMDALRQVAPAGGEEKFANDVMSAACPIPESA